MFGVAGDHRGAMPSPFEDIGSLIEAQRSLGGAVSAVAFPTVLRENWTNPALEHVIGAVGSQKPRAEA